MADDFDYLDFLRSTWREADEARKPLELGWRAAWDLYNNRVDFTKKAPWQTQVALPRFPQTIETAAAVLKRAMIGPPTWYVVEGTTDPDKVVAGILKKLEDHWLRFANFVTTFADGIKLAGIVDFMPVKLTWPSWDEDDIQLRPVGQDLLGGLGDTPHTPRMVKRKRSGLKVELLDPFRVWPDPSGQNRYIIEETLTDKDELVRMAKMAPDIWDTAAIEKISEEMTNVEDQYLKMRRGGLQMPARPAWRKTIRLRTYWGDVVDPIGDVIGRDMTFTIANDLHLVGKPRPIPYWHRILDRRLPNKRGPIIWGSLFRVPLATYGKGFGRDNIGLAKVLTDLTNAIGDESVFASINAFEVDIDMIEDAEQFKDGVYPGKTFFKRGSNSNPGRQMIEPKVLGQVNPQSLAVLAFFDRAYQNSTGVTDYIASAQPTRQTPTLGEYQGRQSQALGLLDMVARNLEDQLLEPILETVYWLILQYMDDFSSKEVIAALGPDVASQLASMTEAERFRLLKAGVTFQARGMSVVLAKGEELQKVATFLQVLPSLIGAVPQLAGIVNWSALFRKVVEGLQWDPADILVNPNTQSLNAQATPGPTDLSQPGSQPGSPDMSGQAFHSFPMNPNTAIPHLLAAAQGGFR